MKRNPVRQKALSLLLSLTLVLGIFWVDTVGAFAAQSSLTTLDLDSDSIYITDSGYFLGEFDVPGGGNFISNSFHPKDSSSGGYLITQSNSNSIQKRITVQSDKQNITQNITIKDINIDGSMYEGFCAFSIEQGAKVNLTLRGNNTLHSGRFNAGLQVSSNMLGTASSKPASLTITEQSDGSSLTATGGDDGAGIGDGVTYGSNITILGGIVRATGGYEAAGIGGSGGGSGFGGDGGNVVISGTNTNVTAIGNYGGTDNDIGSGAYGTSGGTLSVSGGATVIMRYDGTNAVNPDTHSLPPKYIDCKIFIGYTETDYDENGIPTAVWDLENGDITIESDGYDVPVAAYRPPTKQLYAGGYIIKQSNSGNTTSHTVTVQRGTHNITIKDINIMADGNVYPYHYCPFSISPGAAVNLTLEGSNTLRAGNGRGGLEVPANASLTITGDGSLTATGGADGAGIGSANGAGGSITVSGGTVKAQGGPCGAGIGGGYDGAGGSIIINGGTVTATGGDYGAGIGGGISGAGGNIIMNGGTVKAATGGISGAGIGGGLNGAGGTVTINDGIVKAYGIGGGAGIGGGGCGGAGGTVKINGGTVTAAGGSADGGGGAGIGVGGGAEYSHPNGGSVTIIGGNVTATGGMSYRGFTGGGDWVETYGGAGIGGSGSAFPNSGCRGGVITISGKNTKVTAEGQDGGRDIGSGDKGIGGGTLTVGDGSTAARLPVLELLSAGTDATNANNSRPQFMNCVIQGAGAKDASSNDISGLYDANGKKVTTPVPPSTPQSTSGGSRVPTPAAASPLPSSVSDAATGAQIDLSGAVLPAGVTSVTLSVTQVTQNSTADPQGANVFRSVLSDTKLNVIGTPFVYNIKLLDQNGNPVTFTGSVQVRLPLSAGLRGTPRVFRYEGSTGAFTDMNATVQNGFLVFATTHFSYYVVAGTGDSITLDTTSYQMPVDGKYQIGMKLTGSKAASVKFYSTNSKTAAVAKLKNGNYQVTGRSTGTVWIMFDVYDNKNHLLTHASTCVDVKTGIRPRGDSTRQIGVY